MSKIGQHVLEEQLKQIGFYVDFEREFQDSQVDKQIEYDKQQKELNENQSITN